MGDKRRRKALPSDRWMDFGEVTFDPDDYTEDFYFSHAETDVEDRCNDLMNLRYQTQDLLRQKVSSHYKLFMKGTEDIQLVEQDLVQLRKLLNKMLNSLQSLDQASSSVLAVPRAAFSNDKKDKFILAAGSRVSQSFSHTYSLQDIGDSMANKGTMPISPTPRKETSKFPKWLLTAVEDVERLIIERQRAQSVQLIERVRVFFSNLSPEEGGQDILNQVNQHAELLCSRIIKDLEEMSRSILYDFRDTHRQLVMLIVLGKADTAVDFFIRSRGDIVERSMRMMESEGNALSYVTSLSEKFFGHILDACSAFSKLFSEGNYKKTDCFSRLVIWVDEEVRRYSCLIGRQLSLTRRDLLGHRPVKVSEAAMTSQHRKDSVTPRRDSISSRRDSTTPPLPACLSPHPTSPKVLAVVSPRDHMSRERSHWLGRLKMGALTNKKKQRDPDSMISGAGGDESFVVMGACLEVSFCMAYKLDKIGLPVKYTMAEVLGSYIDPLIEGYVQTIMEKLQQVVGEESFELVQVKEEDFTLEEPQTIDFWFVSDDEDDEEGEEERGIRKVVKGGGVKVLGSAKVLVREVKGLIRSFLMLKEPKEATIRYSDELMTIDRSLVRGIMALFRDYAGKLQENFHAKVKNSTLKKTPAESKEKEAVDVTLEAMIDVTFPSLEGFIADDSINVDQNEMRDDLDVLIGEYVRMKHNFE